MCQNHKNPKNGKNQIHYFCTKVKVVYNMKSFPIRPLIKTQLMVKILSYKDRSKQKEWLFLVSQKPVLWNSWKLRWGKLGVIEHWFLKELKNNTPTTPQQYNNNTTTTPQQKPNTTSWTHDENNCTTWWNSQAIAQYGEIHNNCTAWWNSKTTAQHGEILWLFNNIMKSSYIIAEEICKHLQNMAKFINNCTIWWKS